MKNNLTLIALLFTCLSYGQSLPIDFESSITTSDFEDFSGGVAMVIDNPQSSGINTSATVAQIVRDGGDVWAGSKIMLTDNLDFSVDNVLSMKVFTTAPIGTVVKFKVEGDGSDERDAVTTVTNEWEEITWDFTGVAPNYNTVVFMFDFGNTGNGSAASTFLFDDVEQRFGGTQIDLPVDFEGDEINYTVIPFEGNTASLVQDPTDENNTVIQSSKTNEASASGGTTIGTAAGFATDIPLTLTDSKMNVRVWSPAAGIPIRLKVEDSNDVTHTCETETNTTVAGWETMEFDFVNQAPGTESLSVGLQMGWTYNKASIFFNFGVDGAQDGGQVYYFDDVKFGELPSAANDIEILDVVVAPNPTSNFWNLTSTEDVMHKVELYNINGTLLETYINTEYQLTISSENFVSGIYLTKITSDRGIGIVRLVKR